MSVKNKGAILVISLILLIVLSGLVIAGMNLGISSFRVSRNFSGLMQAQAAADSAAAYGLQSLKTYTPFIFPLPKTCTSAASCNSVINTFPYNGRPTFVWASGLTLSNLVGNAGSPAWWQANGYEIPLSYAGNTNAYVIATLLGSSTSYPFTQNYQVVGFGTDSTGTVRATSEPLYMSIKGYQPDPYPASGSNLWTSSTCPSGCAYGECCVSGTCTTNATLCASSNATYVPPGWFCDQYFVTGAGYAASTCNNNVAQVLNGLNILVNSTLRYGYESYFVPYNTFPQYVQVGSTTVWYNNWVTVNYEDVYRAAYEVTQYKMMMHVHYNSGKYLTFSVRAATDGTMQWVCGTYSSGYYPSTWLSASERPPFCTCNEVNSWYINASVCTGQ